MASALRKYGFRASVQTRNRSNTDGDLANIFVLITKLINSSEKEISGTLFRTSLASLLIYS